MRTRLKYYQVSDDVYNDDLHRVEIRNTWKDESEHTHIGLLERQEESDTYVGIKQKILDKVAYCKQRRRVLLDHVHEVGMYMGSMCSVLIPFKGQRGGVWEYQPKSMQELMSSLRL